MTQAIQDAPVAEGLTADRERILVPSSTGVWWCVAELHSRRRATVPNGTVASSEAAQRAGVPGGTPEEADFEIECFECSGWFPYKARAGKRRAWLAREGRWLAESSKERMRNGETLRVSQLEWAP